MRKNIKLEIVIVSKKLFNELGYNGVSTQDIADAMGISKGNLNYHFKKKEDIIEAIVEEMHSHYVKPTPPTTLEELNTLFIRVQQVIKENAFYFWHFTQLAQMSERIREIQNNVIGNNFKLFSDALKLLNKSGSLQNESYSGQYEQLARSIMLTCTYWTPYSKLEEMLDSKGAFLVCVWGIIYPLMTEQGKFQYKNLKSAVHSTNSLPPHKPLGG